jgi:hypothetical protein
VHQELHVQLDRAGTVPSSRRILRALFLGRAHLQHEKKKKEKELVVGRS